MESLWPEPSTVLYIKYKKINKKKNNQGKDFTNISKHPLGNMSMIHVHHRSGRPSSYLMVDPMSADV